MKKRKNCSIFSSFTSATTAAVAAALAEVKRGRAQMKLGGQTSHFPQPRTQFVVEIILCWSAFTITKKKEEEKEFSSTVHFQSAGNSVWGTERIEKTNHGTQHIYGSDQEYGSVHTQGPC